MWNVELSLRKLGTKDYNDLNERLELEYIKLELLISIRTIKSLLSRNQ